MLNGNIEISFGMFLTTKSFLFSAKKESKKTNHVLNRPVDEGVTTRFLNVTGTLKVLEVWKRLRLFLTFFLSPSLLVKHFVSRTGFARALRHLYVHVNSWFHSNLSTDHS